MTKDLIQVDKGRKFIECEERRKETQEDHVINTQRMLGKNLFDIRHLPKLAQ